jgi:PAS domain S-box-containing protein
MGYLISDSQERIRQSSNKIALVLKDTQEAKEKISSLYQETLEIDQLRTHFFSNISHELRTPLTLILGPLNDVLSSPDLDDKHRHRLELVERNARFLYRHVTDLLDVAKLEARRMPLRYATLDLARLTRVLFSHFESLAENRGIHCEISTPDSLSIQADGEMIERILLNLLSNAFKFVPDGGTIGVRLRGESQQAILEVRDNGPGIPAEMRLVVFERFHRIDGKADHPHGGTGLGLSIVKEFVTLHDGEVVCDEAPGGGALFIVTLPLSAPSGREVAADYADGALDSTLRTQILDELWRDGRNTARSNEVDAAPTSSAPLVLVVEDNPDMNDYIVDSLKSRFRISRAFDGESGLKKALAVLPDLIVTDMMMPKISGDRMAVELRCHLATANIPVVMLTAKADEAQRVKLLEFGIQDYIAKPFSADELLARLVNLVNVNREAERARLQLAAIVESSDDAIIGKTLNGIITSWNKGAENIFGYSEEEAVGNSIVMLFPKDREAEEQNILSRIARGENVKHFETVRLRKDGSSIDISATISPIKDRQGTVVGASKIARDISQQKIAEIEIRRLNNDLERRVAERTRDLQTANRELDSFAYAVSHDLRAPLRAMSGFSKALEEDFGDQLTDHAHEFLNEICQASRRMGALIDGILALSHITRGELRRELVDLSAIGEQVRHELARNGPDRQVAWDIQSGIVARGDSRMIEVVIQNLLDNAWKYTALSSNAHIRFFTENKNGETVFCVQDNGAGFNMAHSDRLFKPFQRLHRQDEFTGLGIGLATVQRIIHRHGGAIEADAAVGQGATFRFTLPVQNQSENNSVV